MFDKLFNKQIYTIVYDVIFNNAKSGTSAKVLADDYEDAKRIIKSEYTENVEIIFNEYNPFRIEKVSDYINETTIKDLLLHKDIVIEEDK